MRILHFIYDHMGNPWVGGGGVVRVYEIYRRLSGRHEITVVCGKYPGAKDYEEDGLKFCFAGTDRKNYVLSTFSYALKANRYLKKHGMDADIVIEDFAPWNPLFSYRLGEKPVVLQLQNYLGVEILKKYLLLGIPFWLIERLYPRRFKNFIVLVDALAESYRISGNVRTISMGIEDDYLKEPPSEGKYMMFMGRLDIYQKGLDVLAKAMPMTNARFLIAGDGKEREKFLKMCSGFSNFDMPGFLRGQGKKAALRDSMALVLPSRYEGQGIVVLEAAAMGKPAVVSDIPELRYAVEGGFALSFREGDPKDLSEKMNLLIKDEALRNEMGRKARSYAEGFTWETIALETEEFLKEAASSGAKKR